MRYGEVLRWSRSAGGLKQKFVDQLQSYWVPYNSDFDPENAILSFLEYTYFKNDSIDMFTR